MKTLTVRAPSRHYPVYIGSNLSTKLRAHIARLSPTHVFVIYDRRLQASARAIKKSLARTPWNNDFIAVQGGESFKEARSILKLAGRLIQKGARRDCLVVALGGGSIGDGAGFLASTLMRGVPWFGVPTTLLAQVDSSIGGKTAINFTMGQAVGKNLIGTFHQPSAVFCDVNSLKTLNRRELISGLGEVLKYGLTFEPSFFFFIKKNWNKILRHHRPSLTTIIYKSAKWKAHCVREDEYDTLGKREVLNFGHTFGHALEAVTRFRVFQHGEGVIWGMRFALALSVIKAGFSPKIFTEVDTFLRSISVPAIKKGLLADIFEAMTRDKKVRRGKIHFVLLKKLGRPVSVSSVSQTDLWAAAEMLGLK